MLLTDINENLLKTTFASGDALRAAWNVSRDAILQDRLDAQSYTILPAVYLNLYRNRVQDPLLEKLKGVYRKTWCLNQRYLYAVGSLVEQFEKNHIQPIFMKDIALYQGYYHSYRFRPLYGIRILISRRCMVQTFKLLKILGWQLKEAPDVSDAVRIRPSFFTDGRGHTVTLCSHLFDTILYRGAENEFRRHSTDFLMNGKRIHVFAPTDQLFYLCLIAARQKKIIYLLDIITVLEASHSAINWERFGYHVSRGRCASAIQEIATLITDRLGQQRWITLREKSAHRADSIPFGSRIARAWDSLVGGFLQKDMDL